jgi:hypothetical protein
MALAVFGVVVLPWLSERNSHDITAASGAGAGDGPSAKLPDIVTLTCLPESIDVPNASIRPQANGMHLRVVNKLGRSTEVWVESETGWSSGRFTVKPDTTNVVVSAPPGRLVVGCHAGKQEPERDVELVDADGVHRDFGLDCPEDKQGSDPTKFQVPTEMSSLAEAARRALAEQKQMPEGSHIAPYNGYSETLYTTPMADPAVRVVRDGDTVAIVHLTGTVPDDATDVSGLTMKAPWREIHLIEFCPAFRQSQADTGSPSAS